MANWQNLISPVSKAQLKKYAASTYTLPGDTNQQTITEPAYYTLEGVPFGAGASPWANPQGSFGNSSEPGIPGTTTFGNDNVTYVIDKDGNVVSARVKVDDKAGWEVPFTATDSGYNPDFSKAKMVNWDTNSGNMKLADVAGGIGFVLGGAGGLNALTNAGLLGAGGTGASALGAPGMAAGEGSMIGHGLRSVQDLTTGMAAGEGGLIGSGLSSYTDLGTLPSKTLPTVVPPPSSTALPTGQASPPGGLNVPVPNRGGTKLLETALTKLGLDPATAATWASGLVDVGKIAIPAYGAYQAYKSAKDAGQQRPGAASPEVQEQIKNLIGTAPWKGGGLASGGAPANAGGLFKLTDLPGSPWGRY